MMEKPFLAISNATIPAPSANPLPLQYHVASSKEDMWTSALAVYVSIAWTLWRMSKILQASRACLVSLMALYEILASNSDSKS